MHHHSIRNRFSLDTTKTSSVAVPREYFVPDYTAVARRVRACDYLVVAQLFLQSNFLLQHPLTADDIKPRLLGHWGTCHGINVVYANLRQFFPVDDENKTSSRYFSFILGPGHGYPALQANLYYDGELLKVDPMATLNGQGLAYVCRNFSWPYGFPSHSSPITPHVICEGGELGYALATAYGYSLGHPERLTAVLIGDGEFETATTLGTLNLNHLLASSANGRVLPILHLNGYKISAPAVIARKSERELNQILRGFGYTPIHIWHEREFAEALKTALQMFDQRDKTPSLPFLVFHSKKGAGGPTIVDDKKVADNYLSHQIPLPNAKTDSVQLKMLSDWLYSYRFNELFNSREGFIQ